MHIHGKMYTYVYVKIKINLKRDSVGKYQNIANQTYFLTEIPMDGTKKLKMNKRKKKPTTKHTVLLSIVLNNLV